MVIACPESPFLVVLEAVVEVFLVRQHRVGQVELESSAGGVNDANRSKLGCSTGRRSALPIRSAFTVRPATGTSFEDTPPSRPTPAACKLFAP